jgi:hypothetical protein
VTRQRVHAPARSGPTLFSPPAGRPAWRRAGRRHSGAPRAGLGR